MQAKVIKNFLCKNRNRYYTTKDIYESLDKKRIEELQKKGYLEKPQSKSKKVSDDNGTTQSG
ncbi:hypothetical protein ACFOZ1_15265 [Gracilibacillus marinus]|uniref:Fur-regulated basic protein FbpA n=1 Tax=Gracilibacillus marinus TaxID=630535 RepID=A0ABV8W1F6_9BACI